MEDNIIKIYKEKLSNATDKFLDSFLAQMEELSEKIESGKLKEEFEKKMKIDKSLEMFTQEHVADHYVKLELLKEEINKRNK